MVSADHSGLAGEVLIWFACGKRYSGRLLGLRVRWDGGDELVAYPVRISLVAGDEVRNPRDRFDHHGRRERCCRGAGTPITGIGTRQCCCQRDSRRYGHRRSGRSSRSGRPARTARGPPSRQR